MDTPEEFKAKMQAIADGTAYAVNHTYHDPEIEHTDADELLVQTLRDLGYGDGCDIFKKMTKWYG